MNEKVFVVIIIIAIILCVVSVCSTGCTTRPPVVIDTGNIERVREEYNQLREQYKRLESDYQQLTEEQQFYVDYYRSTTAAIESGLNELSKLGTDSAGEIQRLRSLVLILKDIIYGIIERQQREGQQNSQIDRNNE